MQFAKSTNELLYYNEILRAKLELRDHYLKTLVRAIYENTGQVLSLVRIQLAMIGSELKEVLKTDISDSGTLVAQVICSLRDMSRKFYPENEILTDSGLINALKQELKVDAGSNPGKKITVKGIPSALSPGPGIIFFVIILEITALIKKSYDEESMRLKIIYTKTCLLISITYSGEPLNLSVAQPTTDEILAFGTLSITERVELIGGQMTTKTGNKKRTNIELQLPLH